MKKHTHKNGFTLIEMLVVIAIIALLAGMLFPAITAAIQTSYRRRASMNCKAIESAILMYMNDHNGRFPVPGSAYGQSDQTYFNLEGSKNIIRVLTAESGGFPENNSHGLNPKKKVYLSTEVPSEDGTYPDPWGTQYQIILDLDMNGKITYPSGASDAHRKKAVVVSAGKSKNFDNNSDNIANVELP